MAQGWAVLQIGLERGRGTSEQYITSGIYEPILQIINAPAGTIQNAAGDFIKGTGSLIKGEEIKYLQGVGRKERQASFAKANASGGEIEALILTKIHEFLLFPWTSQWAMSE